jgi:hypothetical protein
MAGGLGLFSGPHVLAAHSAVHPAVQPRDGDEEDFARQSCGSANNAVIYNNWVEVTSVTVGKAEDHGDVMPEAVQNDDDGDVEQVNTNFNIAGDVISGASLEATFTVDNAGATSGTYGSGNLGGSGFANRGVQVTIPVGKEGTHVIHAWVRVNSGNPTDWGQIGGFCLTTRGVEED